MTQAADAVRTFGAPDRGGGLARPAEFRRTEDQPTDHLRFNVAYADDERLYDLVRDPGH